MLDTVHHYDHNSQQLTSLLAHRVSSSRCYNKLNSHLSVSELFDSRLTDVGARSGNSALFSPVSHHVVISPLPCVKEHTRDTYTRIACHTAAPALSSFVDQSRRICVAVRFFDILEVCVRTSGV